MTAEQQKRAAADRDLALKRAAFQSEVNSAEATAAVAYEIEKAKQGQTVSILSYEKNKTHHLKICVRCSSR